MYHICFIHSSVRGHLDCFLVLAIVNRAAVNAGVLISFRIMVFSRYSLGTGLLGHMVAIYLVFKGISILFSVVAAQFTFLSTVWEGSLFSTPSPVFIVLRL